MPLWSNKCSEFEHTSQTNENETCTNDCWGKSNMAEWLAESTWAASVNIVSVFEQISKQTFGKFWNE